MAQILSRIARRDVKNEIVDFFESIDSTTKLFLSDKDSPCYEPYTLRTVQLSLTDRCNLKCIYCYATDRATSNRTLTLNDYFRLLDEIYSISRNVQIVFTGGEPLLSSFFFEVAEYAKKKGNELQLLTNGLLINDKNVSRLTELFDLIKISVDGSTQQIHEKHRGKDTYENTLINIDALLKHNAPLQVAMTVTKQNIKDINGMTKKFGSLLRFSPLFKVGRARGNKKLSVSGKEYYRALSSVNGVNPLGYLCSSLAQAKQKRIMKCAIGDAEISISESGDVYPCQLLHLPEFLAGNIRMQTLESIYSNSVLLKDCSKLNVLEVDGCKSCEIRFICGGACRARAFYEAGDIKVSGEFCEYEKSAFINGLFELHEF